MAGDDEKRPERQAKPRVIKRPQRRVVSKWIFRFLEGSGDELDSDTTERKKKKFLGILLAS